MLSNIYELSISPVPVKLIKIIPVVEGTNPKG